MGIALIAGIAVPAMIIGIPVYVGRKVRLYLYSQCIRFPGEQRSFSADLQPLRGQGQLQTQEEPGDSGRRHALRDRLTCGCSRNCRLVTSECCSLEYMCSCVVCACPELYIGYCSPCEALKSRIAWWEERSPQSACGTGVTTTMFPDVLQASASPSCWPTCTELFPSRCAGAAAAACPPATAKECALNSMTKTTTWAAGRQLRVRPCNHERQSDPLQRPEFIAPFFFSFPETPPPLQRPASTTPASATGRAWEA